VRIVKKCKFGNIHSKLGEDTAAPSEILTSEGAQNDVEKLSHKLNFEELNSEIIKSVKVYKVKKDDAIL
jgi:hypothetical protein